MSQDQQNNADTVPELIRDAFRQMEEMRDNRFKEELKNWIPASETQGLPTWQINEDGSITVTIPSVIAANLADELINWERMDTDWWQSEDCKNWKRSPIARENRRQAIVYGNVLSAIKCLLHRPSVNALMARIKELSKAQNDESQEAKQE